jgi:hypothetical protein
VSCPCQRPGRAEPSTAPGGPVAASLLERQVHHVPTGSSRGRRHRCRT